MKKLTNFFKRPEKQDFVAKDLPAKVALIYFEDTTLSISKSEAVEFMKSAAPLETEFKYLIMSIEDGIRSSSKTYGESKYSKSFEKKYECLIPALVAALQKSGFNDITFETILSDWTRITVRWDK